MDRGSFDSTNPAEQFADWKAPSSELSESSRSKKQTSPEKTKEPSTANEYFLKEAQTQLAALKKESLSFSIKSPEYQTYKQKRKELEAEVKKYENLILAEKEGKPVIESNPETASKQAEKRKGLEDLTDDEVTEAVDQTVRDQMAKKIAMEKQGQVPSTDIGEFRKARAEERKREKAAQEAEITPEQPESQPDNVVSLRKEKTPEQKRAEKQKDAREDLFGKIDIYASIAGMHMTEKPKLGAADLGVDKAGLDDPNLLARIQESSTFKKLPAESQKAITREVQTYQEAFKGEQKEDTKAAKERILQELSDLVKPAAGDAKVRAEKYVALKAELRRIEQDEANTSTAIERAA